MRNQPADKDFTPGGCHQLRDGLRSTSLMDMLDPAELGLARCGAERIRRYLQVTGRSAARKHGTKRNITSVAS
ncbi:hypothetical protein VTN77DRAFT_7538 [Rasamsonia byssochlamydoides]|uniref:uncharacterized protein n=1 Tax=Rasamsonia byssochlamydoides TaxID=89139 RepID=UPI003744A053